MRDCIECPNYVAADDVASDPASAPVKSLGVAWCGAHRKVLSQTGASASQNQQLREAVAGSCSDYGKRLRPTKSGPIQVAQPIPAIFAAVGSFNPTRKVPTTCNECVNHIDREQVEARLGISAPMCATFGQVLAPNEAMLMPKTCGTHLHHDEAAAMPSVPVTIRSTASAYDSVDKEIAFEGVNLMDGYTWVDGDPFVVTTAPSAPTSAPAPKRELTEDSRDMITVPPTPEDAAIHIEGWIEVVSLGRGKKSVLLPVFSESAFTDAEIEEIPRTGDDQHPEYFEDYADLVFNLAVAWHKRMTPLLIGQSGVGKTEVFRHLAWMMRVPFSRISIHKQSDPHDLLGYKDFVSPGPGLPPEQVWIDGRIVDKFGKICVQALDEPNLGPEEVWEVLRPVTDDSSEIILDANAGMRKKKHPHNYFGMTMNPPDDPIYVGAQDISDADGNRLSSYRVGLPPEPVERVIITKRMEQLGVDLNPKDLDKMMAIAVDIRQACDPSGSREVEMSFGIRPQLRVANLLDFYTMTDAYKIAVSNRLDPEGAGIIDAIVSTHTGGS